MKNAFGRHVLMAGSLLAVVLAVGFWLLTGPTPHPGPDVRVPSRIVVVDDISYAPFTFADPDGKPHGISVDIWALWSKKTGVEVDFRLMEWAAALDAVKEGKADVVAGLFKTEEREAFFDFTDPYFRIMTGIFFRKNLQGIRELADLEGFHVGVVKGDGAEELLRDIHPGIQPEVHPGVEELVKSGIETFVADTFVARFYLAKLGMLDDFREATEFVKVNKQYAAVRKGNKELLALVQHGMDMITEAEKTAIVNSWTGVSLHTAIPWRMFGLGLGAVLALLGLMFLWNMELKREVTSATHHLQLRNEELQRSERNYREIFNATTDMVVLHDAVNGRILDMNLAALEMCACRREDMLGRDIGPWSADMPAYAPEKALRRIHQAVAEGSCAFEWMLRRSSGEAFPVEVILRSSSVSGENCVLAVVRDITERKRAEEEHAKLQAQFVQSQKMESVGRLAGGVAHDFNNMLSVILGNADLALCQMDPSQPLYADLVDIRDAARRSADLTRQLLAFARKQTVAPRVLDLNDVVAGMLKMLTRLIGEDIDLAWCPGEAVWPVKMDPAQVDQLLVNLCINARDAIDGVGKITIETNNTVFDATYCATHPGFVMGEYATLSVSDNGCGMDKDTQDKIFEPFFTTKGIGQGTGLGLATVYGIVKQNDGFINVYSEPGGGSTFRIYLARHEAEEAASPAQHSPSAVLQGDETILLVEDDPTIRKVTQQMLEKLGYTVIPAARPEEAIRSAEGHQGQIHLILTDVVMPEMTGRDLAERLLAQDSGLKCLYMSGYTANVIAHHGVLDAGVHFIPKPFSVQDLADKIREALID